MDYLRQFEMYLIAFWRKPSLKGCLFLLVASLLLLGVIVAALDQIFDMNVVTWAYQQVKPWLVASSAYPNELLIMVMLFIVLLIVGIVRLSWINGDMTRHEAKLAALEIEVGEQRTKATVIAETLEKVGSIPASLIISAQKLEIEFDSIVRQILDKDAREKFYSALIPKTNDAITLILSHAILQSLKLYGAPKVFRGGILVPVNDETPYLVRIADFSWSDPETRLKFFIRDHPYNTTGDKSVAGAAFTEALPQVCHWNEAQGRFDHEHYAQTTVFPEPGSETYRAFIALPLCPRYLGLPDRRDNRVLGVLCIDSNDPHAFDGSPYLEHILRADVSALHILWLMHALLQLRHSIRSRVASGGTE